MHNDGTAPLIGIFDMYSASLAAEHYGGMFVSGFGFAASYYGLPDIGFIAWPDMVGFVQRLRLAFPRQHLLVDIDDGYVDPEVACHAVEHLERLGASGVILEDQRDRAAAGMSPASRFCPSSRRGSAVTKADRRIRNAAWPDAWIRRSGLNPDSGACGVQRGCGSRDLEPTVDPTLLWLFLANAAILAAVLGSTMWVARRLRFSTEDQIAIVFCGSKNSLASGLPLASVLLPTAIAGLTVVPLMMFDHMQLIACTWLARRYTVRSNITGAQLF